MPTQTESRLSFTCPACEWTNHVPRAFAGKRGKCGSCKELVEVPSGSKAFAPIGTHVPPQALSQRDMKRVVVETLAADLPPAEALARLMMLNVDAGRAQEVIEEVLAKRRELAVVKTAGGLALTAVGIALAVLLSDAEAILLFDGLIVFGGLTLAAGLNDLVKAPKLG